MHRSRLVLGLTTLTWSGVVGSLNTNSQETPSFLPPFGICPHLSSDATSTICPAYRLAVANQSKSDAYTTSTNSEPSRSAEEQPTAQSPSTKPKPDQPDSSSSSPWSRGSICRRVGKDDYCAFTHSTFNNGEGISVITTPAVFLALGSQPPLSLPIPETGPSTPTAPSGPYKDVAFPGKGIGLVATEPIRASRRIMARTPALMVDDRAFRGLRRDDLALLVAQAIVALPETHRTRFLNLSSSHDSTDSSAPNSHTPSQLDLVYKIFTTNAFKTTIKLSPADEPSSSPPPDSSPPPLPPTLDFQSTFTEDSRLNHDCSPNLGYYFDSTTLSHKVYAVRDILPGEELSVSYVDVLHPLETRQRLLQSTWHFTCSCHRCGGGANTDDPHLTDESNSRIAQINSLRRELDSHTATGASVSGNGGGAGTPAKAELLITLYELEGAQVRIYEAYYRAALEYNGVGDAARAMVYARLCLARGLVARGPDRPFIESMRGLVEDPVGHWSWRFRVGEGGGGNQDGGNKNGKGEGGE